MSAAIYLASGSPRRRELLEQIGVSFELLLEPVDETPEPAEAPAAYVQRLARAKAEAAEARRVCAGLATKPVLAADTCVVLDGRILGKPADREEALAVLQQLGGRAHQVLTAVALCTGADTRVCLAQTDVWMQPIDRTLAERYWATGEPADKAGSYGIQGCAGALVTRIEGSYSAVVGLPLAETAQLLQSQGIAVWQMDA